MFAAAAEGSSPVSPRVVARQPVAPAFGFESVQRMAQARAAQPYQDRSPKLPERLAKLSYDNYRDIRFRPAKSLWRNQALFEVQFFHRGLFFKRRVNLFEVTGLGVRPIPYSAALFDFGRNALRPTDLPANSGFAGFRVHFPLHTPAYKDELITYLGASYFKLLGRNQGYGASARGLAVDTGSSNGEEFPEFTDFWLFKPQPQAQVLTIFALLDSRSITGAYRFDIRPGSASQVQVTSVLYPRRDIAKLGVAPLTSMFFFGENGGRHFEDFRPEVHDSDTLVAQNGRGEWLSRPLVNPRELRISRFLDEHPRGFGLSQRDRNFDHFQDNEARYERRPSYWVQPLGRWGKGSVELVEIPTEEEINDNIVAYWVPDSPVRAGKSLAFSYILTADLQPLLWPQGGKAIATRLGRGGNDSRGKAVPQAARRVVVDFAGGDLAALEKAQPIKAEVSGNGGEISDVTVERLVERNVWRAAFRVLPKNGGPVDLRCNLSLYGRPITETWLYLWTP